MCKDLETLKRDWEEVKTLWPEHISEDDLVWLRTCLECIADRLGCEIGKGQRRGGGG